MVFPVWGLEQIKTFCGSSTLVKVKSTTLIILKVIYILEIYNWIGQLLSYVYSIIHIYRQLTDYQ